MRKLIGAGKPISLSALAARLGLVKGVRKRDRFTPLGLRPKTECVFSATLLESQCVIWRRFSGRILRRNKVLCHAIYEGFVCRVLTERRLPGSVYFIRCYESLESESVRRHPTLIDTLFRMKPDVTELLNRAQSGDKQAGAELLPLVYDELRKLAQHKLVNEVPGQTLQATALVHEAYMRLGGGTEDKWEGRNHFFAAAAQAMRCILVDRARKKQRVKHGGDKNRVELNEGVVAKSISDDVLAVDEVFDDFADKHPEQAEIVKLRYFVGMSNREAAEVMGISTSTADRHWSFARAWLFRELKKHREE